MFSHRVKHHKNTSQIFQAEKIFCFYKDTRCNKINQIAAFRVDWYSLISIHKSVCKAMFVMNNLATWIRIQCSFFGRWYHTTFFSVLLSGDSTLPNTDQSRETTCLFIWEKNYLKISSISLYPFDDQNAVVESPKIFWARTIIFCHTQLKTMCKLFEDAQWFHQEKLIIKDICNLIGQDNLVTYSLDFCV